jgi:hypothetical protein
MVVKREEVLDIGDVINQGIALYLSCRNSDYTPTSADSANQSTMPTQSSGNAGIQLNKTCLLSLSTYGI